MSRLKSRTAFTLIELLVVIGIIVLIASLAVLFVPDVMTQNNLNTGAANLQSWIRGSKSIAVRDQRPSGIRIMPGQTNSLFCNTVLYIQQPVPWVIPNTTVNITFAAGSPATYTVAPNGFTFSGIMPGDFLHITGMADRQIISVAQDGSSLGLLIPANTIAGNSYYPNLTNSPYSIYRGYRPLTGYEPRTLPVNVVIDLQANALFGNGPQASTVQIGAYDIVFSPLGGLYRSTGNSPRIWVRNTDATISSLAFTGSMAYVAVSNVTGFIGVYSIDPTIKTVNGQLVTNPYNFSQKGQSDGM